MPVPTVGLFVPIQAKESHEADVAALLTNSRSLFLQESDTLYWFANQLETPDSFVLFDMFADDAARTAHIEGPIPKALMSGGSGEHS